jgi:hypothetical protein
MEQKMKLTSRSWYNIAVKLKKKTEKNCDNTSLTPEINHSGACLITQHTVLRHSQSLKPEMSGTYQGKINAFETSARNS